MQEPAPAPAPTEPEPAARPIVAALDPACEAPAIDLRAIIANRACVVDRPADADPILPAAIRRTIEPAEIHVRRGEPIRALVLLENTGTEPVDVILRLQTDAHAEQAYASIHHLRSGRRADLGGGPPCATLAARPPTAFHHLRLPAAGTARFSFEVSTLIEEWDNECRARRAGPIRPGRYKLHAGAYFLPDELFADLVIERR